MITTALVIADDLSGAAEIAGIGYRFGLPTRVLRDRPTQSFAGLTVLDTDSRSLPPSQAAERVTHFVESIRPAEFDLIYKKLDSVLRGPIRAEIEALMASLQFESAMLLPQNPSRGRTIVGDEYRIDGVPLDATGFANDPEYPAQTADVRNLIGPTIRAGFEMTIGPASSADDVVQWAQRVGPTILPAGSGDFFDAILRARGLVPQRSPINHLTDGRTLFVCGSASAYSREVIARATQRGIAVCPMPDDVFNHSAATALWADSIIEALNRHSLVIAAILQPIDRSAATPPRIQASLAELVSTVTSKQHVKNLLLEGGATASAICRRMGWHEFEVCGELAPGVVQMRVSATDGPRLVVKPGSYPWPASVWHGTALASN